MFPERKIVSRLQKRHLLKLIDEMLKAPLLKTEPKGKRWFELKEWSPEQIVNLISYDGKVNEITKEKTGEHYIVYGSEYAKRSSVLSPRAGDLFWEPGARFEVNFDDSSRRPGELRKDFNFKGTDEQWIDYLIKEKLLSPFLKDNSAIPVYL